MVESDMSDATADTAGSVRNLNLLDLSDSLLEVILSKEVGG